MQFSGETLSVNEAGLYVQSEFPGWSLWAQAAECHQCDVVQLESASSNSSFFKFDAQYNWKLELRNQTNGTFLTSCNLERFDERSIYVWKYGSHEDSIILLESTCDPYVPAYLVAIAVIIFSVVFYRLLRLLLPRSVLLQRIFRSWSTAAVIENDLGSPDEASELIYSPLNTVQRTHQNRVRSLDVFRGLTICSMIFVNYGGGCFWFFEHSAWNGLTFADVLFPWFAWIMGVGISIKVKNELRNIVTRKSVFLKLTKRSIILVALGVISTNFRHNDLNTIRYPGVLQRLGVAYFIVGTIESVFMTPQPDSENPLSKLLDFRDCWKQWIVVCGLVVTHTCLTFLLPVPHCPTGYLGPGGRSNHSAQVNCTGGAAGYIDKLIFTEDHLYQRPTCQQLYGCETPYDPEGLLGVLTTVLCVYLGVHAARILQVYKLPLQRIVRWHLFSFVSILVAFVLCGFSKEDGLIPLNKNLWSLSYVFMCGGLAFSIFSTLYIIVDKMKWWRGTPFYQAGMNPLVLYFGHIVFQDTLPWEWKLPPWEFHEECVFMNAWATTLWIVIAVILHKRNIFLTV